MDPPGGGGEGGEWKGTVPANPDRRRIGIEVTESEHGGCSGCDCRQRRLCVDGLGLAILDGVLDGEWREPGGLTRGNTGEAGSLTGDDERTDVDGGGARDDR